jgi:DNA topoisomerase-2
MSEPTTVSGDKVNEMFFHVEQKTDKQHILDNPDTYIGGIDTTQSPMWVMANESTTNIADIEYIPALFKLFDEGIVNCRDHVMRMKTKVENHVPDSLPVSYIDISIDAGNGTISMMNDGNGIDVVKHPEYGVWVPELIFGHLRTSTNYNAGRS